MRTVFFCVHFRVDWQTKKDYSTYVMRQASRRSWRIGQTRPVKVVFMSYRNTLQADALKLVAQKLQSSLAVEGELPEDGLAAYGDDGDDVMMALARKIVSGDEEEGAETVEEVFAQARDAEAAGRGVPSGRRLEGRREPAPCRTRGRAGGHSGQRRRDQRTPRQRPRVRHLRAGSGRDGKAGRCERQRGQRPP